MTDKLVQNKFDQYPSHIKPTLESLRQMIYDLVLDLNLGDIEETLKWGEPSFKVKSGSPIRIDYKTATPDHCYIFLNCQTKLVDTYRELYSDVLEFQGNRAIVLNVNNKTHTSVTTAIKHCLTLALTYQKVKHLPLLGA